MGTASFQTWGKLLLSRGARKIHVCVLLLRFGGAVIGGSDFKSHRLCLLYTSDAADETSTV